MATESILEQYRIYDFVSWHRRKELILNPSFQRRSVWDLQARVILIDSILRRMPIPKVYMRTKIDTKTKQSIREVVDGQQRLRAIIDFASDGFRLTRRAGEFNGKKYSDLDAETQANFLAYPLAVDSLVNASDSDVLEVFARLNSYTVTLNAAEKRHAKYQGDFKWAVHTAAKDWKVLWEDYEIVTGRDRLRMGDDSLMAEMFRIIMEGLTDGGAALLDKFYARNEDHFDDEFEIRKKVDRVLGTTLTNFGHVVKNTPLRRAPQFLMLYAAVAAATVGIPAGELNWAPAAISRLDHFNTEEAGERLVRLAEALESDAEQGQFRPFVNASKGTTQRISTRTVRYMFYRWALTGELRLTQDQDG